MPPPPRPQDAERSENHELDQVGSWRFACARKLGYDELQALLLAESRADLHELADLVSKGCPLDVASKIVL